MAATFPGNNITYLIIFTLR